LYFVIKGLAPKRPTKWRCVYDYEWDVEDLCGLAVFVNINGRGKSNSTGRLEDEGEFPEFRG